MDVTLNQTVERLSLNKYESSSRLCSYLFISFSPFLLQVAFVIEEATSPENLCQLYEGWTPWV